MLLSDTNMVTTRRARTLVGAGGLSRTVAGFTLIEAMITVGLLAIALGMAVPSYTSFVIRANRTEALQGLMAVAACQERRYSGVNAYDETACESSSANGDYVFSITTSNGNHSFIASAVPQGAQAKDHCGVLSINQAGTKIAGGQTGSFATTCWKGK